MKCLMLNYSLLILISSLFCISNCTNLPSQHDNHVALFIFGDSLFDAGNNNYLKTTSERANFWPYGKTYFNRSTGRFSNGRIIPDFIAEYMKLPLIRPYLEPNNSNFTNGVNFASGGAGALVETFQRQTIDLQTQLSNFKEVGKQLRQKLGDTKTKALFSKAIYLFNIGTNDYISPLISNYSTKFDDNSRKELVGMVIGNFTTVIKEIYTIGGRKFGILSMGAVGLAPLARVSNGFSDQIMIFTKLHNNALFIELKKLQEELQNFNYSFLDSYTSEIQRINNPSKYGFKVAETACCGSGPFRGMGCGVNKNYKLCKNMKAYLFFDGNHPTEKLNYQLAKLMWSGRHDLTRPYNLRTLIKL